MYMSSCVNFNSYNEAHKAMKLYSGIKVIEKHKDGSAAIVILSETPLQPGQAKYKGTN